MASALIFLHLVFLAIDRTLTHWVSPDATAVETHCVTRRGPLTVGFKIQVCGILDRKPFIFQSIDCIVIICSQATCPACPISSRRRGRRVDKRARDPTTKYSTPITGYR